MKKLRLFLFLFAFTSFLFADNLTGLFNVPYKCEINLAVKIIKDYGFQIDNIEYYKSKNNSDDNITIYFIPSKDIYFHSTKITSLKCVFNSDVLFRMKVYSECSNFENFEKSLKAQYPYLEISDFLQIEYRCEDIYSKIKLYILRNENQLEILLHD